MAKGGGFNGGFLAGFTPARRGSSIFAAIGGEIRSMRVTFARRLSKYPGLDRFPSPTHYPEA